MLKLSLLGPFIASYNDQPLQEFQTNKVQALLIYLAVGKDRPHLRESLMELLWPGMPRESSQINLRQTVYRLRKAIPEVSSISRDERVPLVLSDRQSVQLNPEAAIDLDVTTFQSLIEEDPAKAVKLYRGDFLSDFYLVDSSDFEAWAERNRERLRREMLDVLDTLAVEAIEAGDHHQAQTYAWQQLEIDSLRESAYRQLMRALADGGQRNAALAQYQVCRRRLVRELGLEPSLETTALYEGIQADALKTTKEPPPVRIFGLGEMLVFMLTDIEGSTRLWDTYRQAMLPALLTHNQILSDHISNHGGRILELRGDGVKAVFEGVNPLDCVLDIQRALGEANWGEIGDLRIRIGLHGVPPVHKDFDYFIEDDKYYGPVLNHTARIMDAGHGGQILVSEQVYNAFSVPQGASWQDFKHHHVKGLEQPVHIYGLVHPALPLQSFPPLRTGITPTEIPPVGTARVRHNLVPQLTPFIGRHDELSKLDAMLQDPDTRLITITGPGGMGKTRLAIACAERQLTCKPGDGDDHQFPDGIFFVSLEDIENPDQIPSEIAKALSLSLNPGGIPEQERFTVEQQLMGYLRRKQVLLVLDNLEQLLDGTDLLTEILQTAPSVQILVTSRERLHLQLEQIFRVEGLDFPDWEAPEDPRDYTAMQLYLESARRVRPDFKITTNDMVYLTRICYQLGGMPLGLELAASWVNLLSVEEIAVELKKGLDLLETDARDLPARHRSLQVVCDSTWKRLNSAEKDVFARLSVFRGGFTRKAAQEVAGASLRILASLHNISLLGYDPINKRYRIHPYLRNYGVDQLSSNPKQVFDTRDRHSAYFCEVVESYVKKSRNRLELNITDPMNVDIANITSAWDWIIDHEEVLRIKQVFWGLVVYFYWFYRYGEILRICEEAMDVFNEIDNRMKSEEVSIIDPYVLEFAYAKTQITYGIFIHDYDKNRSTQLFNQSNEKLNNLADAGYDIRSEKARLLRCQAITSEDYKESMALFSESITTSKEINDDWGMIESLSYAGEKVLWSDSPVEAINWFERALSLARDNNDSLYEITNLVRLGEAYGYWLASYDEAVHYYKNAISKAFVINNDRLNEYTLRKYGEFLISRGQLEEARESLEQSIRISENTGLLLKSSSLLHLADVQWLAGDFEEAEISLCESINFQIDTGLPPDASPMVVYSQFLALTGRYDEALEGLNPDHYFSKDLLIDDFVICVQSRVNCWVALIRGQYVEAKTNSLFRIDKARSISYEPWVAESQADIARAEYGLGNFLEAKCNLFEALSTAIELEGYYQLVFALPVTLLILADEDFELATEVYKIAKRDPFLGRAQLYIDLIYQHLPEEITSIPVMTVETSPGHREALWEAARKVLASWQDGTP